MTVTAFHAVPFNIPLKAPFHTAAGAIHQRQGWIVQLVADTGRVGQGECAPLPGWSADDWEDIAPIMADLSAQLDLAALSGEFNAALAWLDAAFPDHPALRFGLETALADLAAQQAGIPLARWLNPQSQFHLPVNAVIPLGTVEDRVQLGRQRVAEGFSTLKLKVMGLEDVPTLAGLRQSLGSQVQLRLDANGAWDTATAIRNIRAFTPYAITYIEQPVPPHDLQALAEVSRETDVPVAADESVRDAPAAQQIIALAAAQILILKPLLIGGLHACRHIAQLAHDAGLLVVITTSLDSVVGRLATVHLAAACASPGLAQGLATGHLLADDLAPDPAAIAGGQLTLPPIPGLGVARVAAP